MRFTSEQYDQAIQALYDARRQLVPDGKNCAICGGDDHQAFECGHNPLLAMDICVHIAKSADGLHQHLHYLSGHESQMGMIFGPAKIQLPEPKERSPVVPLGGKTGWE